MLRTDRTARAALVSGQWLTVRVSHIVLIPALQLLITNCRIVPEVLGDSRLIRLIHLILLAGLVRAVHLLSDGSRLAVNRLPRETRALVGLIALIGISQSAAFEFHVTNWIGASDDGLPVAPEMARLSANDTLCLYGDDDEDSICPKVNRANARVIELSGGHHFGGDYERLADVILQAYGGRSRNVAQASSNQRANGP